MTTLIIVLAALTMLLLGVAMALVLGWANKAFHVEVNPLVEKALALLPGSNCGGCGFAGCGDYAEAVVAGKAAPNLCAPGGGAVAKALAALLGLEAMDSDPIRAFVHCGASGADKLGRSDYRGERTCGAANMISGVQACTFGCLGMGDCERSCPFDAIHIVDDLAVVDYEKCTGCGACVRACPRDIIALGPLKADRVWGVECCNKDFGKDVKDVCKVGCIGCGLCAKACDLFVMDGKLARMDYEKYDTARGDEMAVAAGKCPVKIIRQVGKPAKAE